MYKIKNNTPEEMFFIDTMGKGVRIPPKESIEHKFPPRDGFGDRLTIEKMPTKKQAAEEKKKETKTEVE